jgi:hypothetical protein
MVVRTCTLRTSLIFLRCALVTKPAEVSVVRKKYGASAATLYHTAFLARNGKDMCCDSNYNWARCYFNRVAIKIFNLQQLFAHAAARMSNHSLETEVGEYAGQATISGAEELDRKVFKALSMEFNCRVFGDAPSFDRAPAPSFGGAAAPSFGGGSAPSFGGAAAPSFGGAAAPSFGGAAAHSFGGAAAPSFGGAAAPSLQELEVMPSLHALDDESYM